MKPDVKIARGERLKAEDLVKLGIPKQAVGNLKEYAVLYDDLHTVEGAPVCRTLAEGSLLLQDDLRTPPQDLDLGKGEEAMGIPVDTRTFVPSLVSPGDLVSFIVAAPTRAVRPRSQRRRWHVQSGPPTG